VLPRQSGQVTAAKLTPGVWLIARHLPWSTMSLATCVSWLDSSRRPSPVGPPPSAPAQATPRPAESALYVARPTASAPGPVSAVAPAIAKPAPVAKTSLKKLQAIPPAAPTQSPEAKSLATEARSHSVPVAWPAPDDPPPEAAAAISAHAIGPVRVSPSGLPKPAQTW